MWLLNENKSPYLVAAIFGGGRAQPILSWQHLVTSAQVPTQFLHFIFSLLPQCEPDFNACALRTLLSIGLALDFHRAPRQNVSVQSFLPPTTSVIVSRVVICFNKRGNIWDVCIEFPSAGTKMYWCAVFYVQPTSKAATFFERTISLKKGADDDLRLEGAPPKGSHH